MGIILGVLAAVGALAGLAWVFSRMKTKAAAQSLRLVLGMLGLILGAILMLRGLAAAGLPLIGASLGLLAVAARGGVQREPGASGGGNGSNPRRRGMSRAEAAKMLGVTLDASEAEINAAYRALMKTVHPDAGGSEILAQQAQEAREVLSNRS